MDTIETPLTDGALWSAMDADPIRWFATNKEMFDEMLEILPPRTMGKHSFLVGEPNHHNSAGEAVYACFVYHPTLDEYAARYMTVAEFRQREALT